VPFLSVLIATITDVKLRLLRIGDHLDENTPLVRGGKLGELIRSGMRSEPTGRNPRHYTASYDDLRQGVKLLADCRHQVMTNPYYDG
jgi:hypothetical protein